MVGEAEELFSVFLGTEIHDVKSLAVFVIAWKVL
jgi:hypothetical protein